MMGAGFLLAISTSRSKHSDKIHNWELMDLSGTRQLRFHPKMANLGRLLQLCTILKTVQKFLS